MSKNKTKYDVIFSSTIAIAPFPRLEAAASCIKEKLRLNPLVVGWDRERKFKKFELKEKFQVLRFQFKGVYGGGLRNLFGLLFFNTYLFALYLKNRPKLIHAYDLDTVLPALLAKPFIRCKVVYDIADWYAQSRRVGRLKRLVEKIDRWVCQKVDYVIIAHEERIKQLGFQPKRLEVLYNSPPDVLKEVKSKQNKCKDYFVYVGVLQPDRGIDKIVEASKLAGTRVLIAGFGPLADYCGKVSSEYSNIEFLGQIPYEKTLELEANAIAILALYNPEIENNKYAAPNKLYEAMMLGKSIITTKDTLVGRFVEKESIGIVIDYNSVDELAMAMNKLQKDSTLSKTMGERSRMLYDKIYSSKKQCDKLCRIYGELLALRNASSQEEIIC